MKVAGKMGALLFEYLAWCFYLGLLQMAANSLWGPGQPASIWLLGGLALLCRWMIEVNGTKDSPGSADTAILVTDRHEPSKK